PTARAPRRGGTLTYAASADITSLDPPNSGDVTSGAALFLVYDSLVGATPDLQLIPKLATSWQADGTAWTFELRRGVRFHDGTPFNAAAVKAHFDRLLGPENTLRAGVWRAVLERVDVVSEFTNRFITKFPFADMPTMLSLRSAVQIESPDAFKKFGKDLARNPVGTGPFKFSEWIKDERFVAVRNDDYWGGAPYLDKVIIRPVPDAQARLIALESGDVQLAIRMSPENVGRLDANERLKKEAKTTTRTMFIGMNVRKKPFSDPRVRQALNYAVDKRSIVANIYGGLAEALGTHVPPGVAGYSAVAPFPYDPAKAKQLLAEAGYPNGFSTTLVGTKGAYPKDFELDQAIQLQLKAVGVDVKLEIFELAKYLDVLRTTRETTLEMFQNSFVTATAVDYIEQQFGCDQPTNNSSGFCDRRISDLAQEALRTTDEAKRGPMLKQAQDLLAQQTPAIWLLGVQEVAGMSRKLHGAVFRKDTILTVDEKTWLEE
ncbi:MAG: hypothetical protein FJ034_04850, partial [Chloroflexi bacterium]|nr:hypothetical protein [Chloroflexota bacterium]